MNTRWAGIDPRLYFVTDSELCARAGRSVAETAAAAVTGGAGMVQVRDKQLDDDDFYALTRTVLDAVAAATAGSDRRVPVVVNDRVAVAKRLWDEGWKIHIHVGQGDMPAEHVRSLLGPAPLLGVSVASHEELNVAQSSGAVDLIGIGPVFDTATKPDAGPEVGVAQVHALAQQARIPALAIGGINLRTAAMLRSTGVIGICVVSALCLADDPAAMARAMLAAFGDPRA